jgi:DNA-binding Lrp family transcriptional regulator
MPRQVISDTDRAVLCRLRLDGRMKAQEIARRTAIPATTVYDKMRSHVKKGIVKRHVALLDFSKLGYGTHAMVLVHSDPDRRIQLKDYLSCHEKINSAYLVNTQNSFLIEAVCRSLPELNELIESIQREYGAECSVFHVIDELRKEEFFAGGIV